MIPTLINAKLSRPSTYRHSTFHCIECFCFNVYRREVVDISEENVFITDVENGSDNDSVQFTMFVTTSSDRSSFLKPESIESCLKVRDMLQNIFTHYSLFRVARKS